MKWRKKEIDQQEIRELARRFGLDLLVSAILARRSVTEPEELPFFIENDARFLHNPFLLSGMTEAVERMLSAAESGEKIAVFGDRDVDGIASTVILVESLAECGADVSWHLPEGEADYGLTAQAVDAIASQGAGLLVTVDCGISNAEEIARAAAAGLDVIVIDHHNPPSRLPDAAAIVNPKLDGSAYPFRELSAAAVTAKVSWALAFARSPFYGETLCLLNARPGNDTFTIEACTVRNLAETGRIVETIVPGMVTLESTRLAGFIDRREIVVFGADAQERFLRAAFGPGVSIAVTDIRPRLSEILPQFAGRGLLAIGEDLKLSTYSSRPPSEIDVLRELVKGLIVARGREGLSKATAHLELAALGTVADLMPLVNENRIIVRQGLAALRRSERRGLREILLRRDLLGREVSAADVAWHIAPLLNSAGRMGKPSTAARLLLAKEPGEAEDLAVALLDFDARRKSAGESAWVRLTGKAKDSLERAGGKLLLVSDAEVPRGITGILASRLQGYFKAPAIVVALLEDKAVGSIRSSRQRIIDRFFDACADLLSAFGGHDYAGGFSLPLDGMEELSRRFYRMADEIDFEKEEAVIAIDAELPAAYLTPDLARVIDFFEPYGEGNPPLAFLTRRITIVKCELMGRKELVHLRLTFDAGKHKWPAVFWNSASRFPGDFAVGDAVDVAYRLEKDFFGGMEKLRMNVLEIVR